MQREETEAILAALRPEGGKRPLVAIIGINDATEVTDYLVRTLESARRASNVARRVHAGDRRRACQLYPALRIDP